MRKVITVFLLIISLMLLLRCKNSSSAQAFYLNGNFIGIREGKTIKYYQTADQKN